MPAPLTHDVTLPAPCVATTDGSHDRGGRTRTQRVLSAPVLGTACAAEQIVGVGDPGRDSLIAKGEEDGFEPDARGTCDVGRLRAGHGGAAYL